MTFSDALVAGEIAVRGYVSEATRHKRVTQHRRLRRAMFQEQPAAGTQVIRGSINKSRQGSRAVAPGRQGGARFVAQAVAGKHRIVGGDVGRIARNGVETTPRERREPVALQPFDAARDQPPAIAARHGECVGRCVGARDLPVAALMRQGDGDAARSGTEVGDRRSLRPHAGEHALDQELGLGPRHEHRGGDFEIQRPEFAAPQKIGDGFARGAARAIRGETLRNLRGNRLVRTRQQCGPRASPRGGEQDFRVAPRDLALRLAQELLAVLHVMGIMPDMSPAQSLPAPVGLLPLPRPLMTGEVLDASYRLFRAGLWRCMAYSGLAVLLLELTTLYSAFFGGIGSDAPAVHYAVFAISLLLGVALLGVVTLRLSAVSRGLRPRFRTELWTVLARWPAATIATLAALGFPVLLYTVTSLFNPFMPNVLVFMLGLPLIWPTALLAVALPAFWCDRLGPLAAIAQAVRVSRRRSWRMVGAILATVCLLAVFYLLAAIIVGLLSPLLGRADLFLIATIRSMVSLVVGAFGLPFIVAMLIVAYEDLKLRELGRRGAAP